MLLCRLGLVNMSTSAFRYIKLTGTMTNLIVAWNFNKKWLQESLLHTKPFKITFKTNSYLMTNSHPVLINPSISTFPIINLTKTTSDLLVVAKITEKWFH